MKGLRRKNNVKGATSKQEKPQKDKVYWHVFAVLLFTYGALQNNAYLITFGLIVWGFALID